MVDIVDAADWPDEGVGMAAVCPLDIPAPGSAFEEGHRPLWGFFLMAPAACSPLVMGISPFGCGGGTGIVNVVEEEEEEGAVEDVEDEELVLCALRRGMNMRVTSSAFIEFNPRPASPGFH